MTDIIIEEDKEDLFDNIGCEDESFGDMDIQTMYEMDEDGY